MNRSQQIAGGILAVLVLWLLSGLVFRNDNDADNAESSAGKILFSVRVRMQRAQPVIREIMVYGRTAPARTITLKAETSGRIKAVGAARGSRVKAGDLIVRIEMRDREAVREQARALVAQRQLEYDASMDLSSKGYQAESQLAGALTLLKTAEAQLVRIDLDIEHTKILSPIDGVFSERVVEVGDFVDVGEVVGILLELDPLIITGEVTEREIKRISVGQIGHGTLATGDVVQGIIRFISSASDPESRTFTVEIEVSNPESRLPAGVTTEILVPGETISAHLVSPALLSLNDAGDLGIKIVDVHDIVRFIPASLVKAESSGLWLAGLPDEARIITVGQGFARPGDKVKVVMESSSGL